MAEIKSTDVLIKPPINQFKLAFPTGRDSETFRDKGTTGQAKNFAKGRNGPGQPKSGTGHGTKWDRAEKDALKWENNVLKQKMML